MQINTSNGEIPVPAPLALLGLGLLAIGYTRKRKA
ncbi:PEP-CTERM sorting domain-containing protein [Sedimenticola selenatireducens]|uniref:PEP-CTERM sorting domain-containing protein n=1 Tax=Sedimenticola selenatireducens TaxID=191960 RepID=A0A558DLN3_9GAMM|nr:PEP-CTERM sorting domain-containing protein [Sedimenticola selenatireducens]TVT61922.1 MAG: PEP-CTERM sorting domain-containing protein [Sedimenticola selenatireducens]